MMDLLAPIHQGSLRDAVLPPLRRAILTGQLPAGVRLSESEIARTMRVSRSPVREAIAQLEQEGLVERLPNRGAFVADIFSRRALGELASLRNVLETFALQLTAARAGAADLAPLYAVTDEIGAAVARGDHEAIAAADFRFHQGLVALAGHRRLCQIWAGIADQYWALYLPRIQEFGEDIEHWDRNHRLILDALAERRPDLATMYLQYNILNSADHLREYLPDVARGNERTGEALLLAIGEIPD